MSSLIFLKHKEWSSPEGKRREEKRGRKGGRGRRREGEGGGGRDRATSTCFRSKYITEHNNYEHYYGLYRKHNNCISRNCWHSIIQEGSSIICQGLMQVHEISLSTCTCTLYTCSHSNSKCIHSHVSTFLAALGTVYAYHMNCCPNQNCPQSLYWSCRIVRRLRTSPAQI